MNALVEICRKMYNAMVIQFMGTSMKDFFRYFMGKGQNVEFTNFSPAHFLPILIAVGIISLIYVGKDKIREFKEEKSIRYVLAFLLIISEMAYYWWLITLPELNPNPYNDLPITVCGWVVVFCSYMVVGKSQGLFDVSYFWLFAGSIFALITPTVIAYTGPTRFRYYQFWAEHLLGYIAVFYMIFVHGMRPSIKGALKAYLALVGLAIIAYFVNTTLGQGANYLFMARPESTPSVLDVLPAHFGLRLFIMAAVITLLFAVAYLPWYVRDRREADCEETVKDSHKLA